MSGEWKPEANWKPHDHDRRMKAARERAEWMLGSGDWAGVILAAYWNPDEDQAALAKEKAE